MDTDTDTDDEIKALSRRVQSLLDESLEPAAPSSSLYLHKRYQPLRENGAWDMRDRDARRAGEQAAVEYAKRLGWPPALRLSKRFPFVRFRDAEQAERELAEGADEADRRGRIAYLIRFALEELEEVADLEILTDFGSYFSRLAATVLGEAGSRQAIFESLTAAFERRISFERLAAFATGAIRIGRPDEETRWIRDLPSALRDELASGLSRLAEQTARTDRQRAETSSRMRRDRYGRAADALASRALSSGWDRSQATEAIAQALLRTSEGSRGVALELRSALSDRFADEDFGDRIADRVARLARDREAARAECEWSAANRFDRSSPF